MHHKILVSLLLLLSFSIAKAQLEKGNISTGAGIDVASTFVAATKYNNSYFRLSISPGLTYFVINNLAIGGNVNFTMDVRRREKITAFLSVVGPVVRYYFGKKKVINKKGFAQVTGGYATSTFLNDGKTSGRDGWFVGGMVGFAYFINKNIAMETSLGYNYNKQKDWVTHNIPFKVGFNIFILPKKKDIAAHQ